MQKEGILLELKYNFLRSIDIVAKYARNIVSFHFEWFGKSFIFVKHSDHYFNQKCSFKFTVLLFLFLTFTTGQVLWMFIQLIFLQMKSFHRNVFHLKDFFFHLKIVFSPLHHVQLEYGCI